ncbi:hypothetical protein GCM10027413_13080 [Conyzicola nivalis]|uniref:Uncharacterized protein n=1 Tax=Conyzicola nivalis TaxID=1477021 RepID=A0A916SGY7_9MICO|nr:hypothetical protein [Conyzicola nivalis]GGB00382.1 hypothetical protein GCM10010979_13550 [Conyzicola nivalis]
MFTLFLEAAGQVALVALLLGAGLPALFAIGVRSFTLAGAAGRPAAEGETTGGSRISVPVLRVIGTLCYVLVVAAVVIGLSVIIATGFGQELSFDNFVLTFVPKD